ncbi:hypothetical protein COCC4DRAFT_26585 [Bipolaris maydis ATCC 48331]|uniref:Uncharacterized protein n=2 Tax=Cochliobolus heterostrophus TaxID=5016 RepID=M2UM75_COCH5|nr:uncharacterized protein COCC4DRAFT_26585 [Bipolaris maydis ATCC 48331]EMD94711.1 hypothetical protein COCHEDRAFT_1191524 [Bipolaris maydis C5]KAH7556083.1 hypothetical protein BM1_06609 [Bipolaris maydis]ENI01577.1 hypothetical protein COCC4DRAFT_26585 [Bipolaris maydis ATCC 48331]KAJ5029133.1 NRDE-2, necessary for RNA interference-domain-containing protein [Bipolaris maydis]KAJ5062136.1 NRDE-2, necessary for RNA interference-domain-containing protein [Bipolaris maydis]
MSANTSSFASFRPKPKPAQELSKEPQPHSQSDRTSKQKDQHRRTSKSPSPQIRETDASANKPYFSDRRGDEDVLRYGTLNRYEIPPYRRYGHGFVLGLPLQQKIDRELSTDKKIYVSPATRRRQQRLLTDKSTKRSGERALRLVKAGGDASDLNKDYVLLSATGKRKRHDSDTDEDDDEGTPEFDYRGIEEPKSAEPADPDAQYESDVDVTFDAEATRTNSRLARSTKEHPEDVSGWLALIAHQEAMLKLERPSAELTVSDKAHLADIRIDIYGEALKKIGKHPEGQLQLYKGLLKEAERAWEGAKLASKWKDVLVKHPESVELWMMYLDFVQSRFTTFKYEDCRAIFFKCIETLSASTQNISPTGLLHIILRLTSMTYEAGYQELSVAIWQALIEFRILRPAEDATIDAFEMFWDSEVARIGEPQSKGWKQYSPSGEPASLEFAPLLEKDSSDSFFEDFKKRETEATRQLVLPGRTSDDIAEDDAFHTILFDDVAPYLKLVPEHVPSGLLVEAFLCFCGLPPIPKSGAHQQSWWSDPFLQRHWSSSPLNEDESSNFVQSLNHFSNCPSKSFQMTTELLFDQSFSTSSIGLGTDFIRQLLKLVASDPSSEDVFGEYLLAFELRNYPNEAFKTAKRLLKARPSSLRLYNAYGLVESRLGNSDKADQVFRTVLAMQPAKSENPTPQLLELLDSWVWDALRRGERNTALWRLVSPHGNPPAETAQSQPDETLVDSLRTRLAEISEQALLAQDHATAILSTSLSALLLYLTSSYDAPRALNLHSHLSIWFTSHATTYSSSAELHAQFISRLLTFHTTHAPIVKPALTRSTLEPLLSRFPDNTLLLALYAANESRFSIDDRVRGVMQHTALQRTEERSIAGWAFAIHYEMRRGELAGSTEHSIRALYKRAVESSGKHCPALWKAYIQFELAQLRRLQESRQLQNKKPRRDGKKSKAEIRVEDARQRVADTFYAGLRNLPWCKEVAMLAFGEAEDVFGDEEKWRVCRVLVEKEMRVFVEVDDDAAWEVAREKGWTV